MDSMRSTSSCVGGGEGKLGGDVWNRSRILAVVAGDGGTAAPPVRILAALRTPPVRALDAARLRTSSGSGACGSGNCGSRCTEGGRSLAAAISSRASWTRVSQSPEVARSRRLRMTGVAVVGVDSSLGSRAGGRRRSIPAFRHSRVAARARVSPGSAASAAVAPSSKCRRACPAMLRRALGTQCIGWECQTVGRSCKSERSLS